MLIARLHLVLAVVLLAACSSDSGTDLSGPDTEPPVVDLVLSTTSVSTTGDITLTADARDAVGVTRVEFYQRVSGGATPVRLGEDATAPYALAFPVLTDLDNGEYEFTAKAYDAAGNVGTSEAATAVVNLPPTAAAFTLLASHDRITTPGRVILSPETTGQGIVRFEIFEGGRKVAESSLETGIPLVTLDLTAADNGVRVYTARGFTAEGPYGNSNGIRLIVDIRWDISAPMTGIQSDGQFYLASDGAGALYLTGTTQTGIEGNIDFDAFLARYDAEGNRVWLRSIADPVVWAQGLSVGVDPSGRPFISGTGLDPNNELGSCHLSVYSTSGDPVWTVNPGAYPCDAAGDAAGNFYVTRSPPEGVIVTKYDAGGQEQWSRVTRSEPANPNADIVTSIATDPQGGIYVSGYTSGNLGTPNQGGGRDVFVVKFDAAGNQAWARTFGTSGIDFGNGLAADPDGGVYVAIGIDDQDFRFGPYGDAAIARLSADGTVLWMHRLDGGYFDNAWSVAADRNGVYLVGFTAAAARLPREISEPRQGPSDGFLAQYSRDGELLLVQLLGGPGHDRSSGVAIGSSGEPYLALVTDGGLSGVPDRAAVIARSRQSGP
jgi:hypothetical protein